MYFLRKIWILLALGMAGAIMPPAQAATLVMVDWQACVYCRNFNREVAREYERSSAGQIAPLRRISVLKTWPADLHRVLPARGTPVFILVENGREIGRIRGYVGRKRFWAQLDPLLSKLQK